MRRAHFADWQVKIGKSLCNKLLTFGIGSTLVFSSTTVTSLKIFNVFMYIILNCVC